MYLCPQSEPLVDCIATMGALERRILLAVMRRVASLEQSGRSDQADELLEEIRDILMEPMQRRKLANKSLSC